jgi:hypothetical protein
MENVVGLGDCWPRTLSFHPEGTWRTEEAGDADTAVVHPVNAISVTSRCGPGLRALIRIILFPSLACHSNLTGPVVRGS